MTAPFEARPSSACIDNPKTHKPYSRHRYQQRNLRVKTYTTMRSGEVAPTEFAFELVCERCGHEVTHVY